MYVSWSNPTIRRTSSTCLPDTTATRSSDSCQLGEGAPAFRQNLCLFRRRHYRAERPVDIGYECGWPSSEYCAGLVSDACPATDQTRNPAKLPSWSTFGVIVPLCCPVPELRREGTDMTSLSVVECAGKEQSHSRASCLCLAFRIWLRQRKPEDLSPALNQRMLVLFQRPTGLAVGLGLKETAPPAPAGHTPSCWFPRSRVRDLACHVWHYEYLVSSIPGTSRPVNRAGAMVCCQPESFTLE